MKQPWPDDHPLVLLVEGDDHHALVHLALRHGVAVGEKVPFRANGGQKDVDGTTDGGSRIWARLDLALKTPFHRLGVVVDADANSRGRWSELRRRFAAFEPPERLPSAGWVSAIGDRRVGAWVMPDNASPGGLEDFLLTLVPSGPLLSYADRVVTCAPGRGASFKPVHRSKAVLATWLAWSDPPGRPPGVAIKAKRIGRDSRPADAFAQWLRDLYEPETAWENL